MNLKELYTAIIGERLKNQRNPMLMGQGGFSTSTRRRLTKREKAHRKIRNHMARESRRINRGAW